MGYGVLYGDDAEETLSDINEIYGYRYGSSGTYVCVVVLYIIKRMDGIYSFRQERQAMDIENKDMVI